MDAIPHISSNASLHPPRISRTRLIMLGAGAVVILAMIWHWLPFGSSKPADHAGGGEIPVDTALAGKAEVPIYMEGLGTVQALYTVTITARVDGQLQKVAFTEGQTVKKGDLLAQIDPRPYQAAYDLATATKEKDAALLENAKRDLQRYMVLAPQDFTSKQTVDTQRSLVAQLDAQVKGDQATMDNAKTQLDYTSITSPIDGRTGVRLVDPGNNVHAADTTGIVVVTQVQPLSVVFTLPEEALPAINTALQTGKVGVAAMSRDGKTELDRGNVALIDNLIDQATGTIKLKATFPNTHNSLWPGQFINARVLVQTQHDVLTIPTAALQTGPSGPFTYVVTPTSTVEVRPVIVGLDNGALVVVTNGVKEGERVVTSNQYRLQQGSHIHVNTDAPRTSAPSRSGQ